MWGHRLFILVSASNDLSSSDSSGSSGSDETDLLSSAGSPPDGGGLANVLMVTTTVGMLHGVHGNTTNLGPAVPLDFVFVVSTTSLQDGLVDTSTTSYKSDHGSVSRGDDLLGSRGELHPGPVGVRVVGDDGGVVAASSGQLATISGLFLQVADNGTLGHLTDGHHVPDGDLGLFAAVDKLSRVHAF